MNPRQYIDFKLYLTRSSDGKGACQVSLLPTTEIGETLTPITVPSENAPSPDLLAQLSNKSITPHQLAILGKQLTNCLLPEGDIRNLFMDACKRTENESRVRLRLIIADNALKQWPWEYAYLDFLNRLLGMHGFLALNPRISFVRHEPLPFAHPTVQKAAEDVTNLRMVIATALPAGPRVLNLDQEVKNIREALNDFKLEGVKISYEPVLMDATQGELAQVLLKREPTYIFHFAGHGITRIKQDPFNPGIEKEEGCLLFVKDKTSKKEAPVSAEDLARRLQPAGVRLAVLGACNTGSRNERYSWDSVAGALVANGIAAVIAMQYEVKDQEWIGFSKAFYGALGSGLSLDEAMSVGRLAMMQTTNDDPDSTVNLEWGVPVLYSRLPNGALFPERMAKPTKDAEAIRFAVDQTIGSIEKGGEVIGVQIGFINGSIDVKQSVGIVKGKMTGREEKAGKSSINNETSSTNVVQEVTEVSEGGQVIGTKRINL